MNFLFIFLFFLSRSRLNLDKRHLDKHIIGAIWGRIYGTIYDTIFLTIHHYGFHNKGAGAEGARPFLVASCQVDGETCIYPTSYGTNYKSVQMMFVQVRPAPKNSSATQK